MIALVITVAFGLGFVARRLGLPPLVGFIVAGFLLPPLGAERSEIVQTAADLGVTLLMFTIGLKLAPKTLAEPLVWAGTLIHSTLTTALFTVVLLAAGAVGGASIIGVDLRAALIVAFALSFSSTVFAVKILEQTGDASATYGKVAIGVLIMQDVLAVAFLAASAGAIPGPAALALVVLVPARPLLHRLTVASGHGELLVVCGLFLALVIGYAAFDFTGVKGDLGALILGVLIGSHPKSKELADALYGLKELLLIGFFVNIGLTGTLTVTGAVTAAALMLVVPIKVALYFLVLTRFGLRARGATLASLTLANYSEFGLIVTAIAVENGWIDGGWLVTIALALSGSLIAASPLCARGYRLYERLAPRLRRFERTVAWPTVAAIDLREVDAVVFGMGRVGTGAFDSLAHVFGPRVVGVDHDADQVRVHQEKGRKVLQGDAIDHEFWEQLPAGFTGLDLVVLALHDQRSNLEVLRLLRHHQYHGVVAAIARYDDEMAALRAGGAQAVHNFYAEAGSGLARDALKALPGGPPMPMDAGAGA